MKCSSLLCGLLAAGLIAVSADAEARRMITGARSTRSAESVKTRTDTDDEIVHPAAGSGDRMTRPITRLIRSIRHPKPRTQAFGGQGRTPKLKFRERWTE